MITACTLVAVLVVEAAISAEPVCALTDNRCKAKVYEQQAASAPTPGLRALYLHSAHRSYLFLFDEAGEAHDLCEARRALRASLTVKDQPDAQRAKFKQSLAALTSREREHKIRCGAPKSPRPEKADALLTATAVPAPAEPAAVVSSAPASPLPDTKTAPARAASSSAETASPAEPAAPLELLTGGVTTRPPGTRDLARVSVSADPDPRVLMPVVTRRRPGVGAVPSPERHAPLPRVDGDHPGRGLVIAGGALLGVGVALTASAGYVGGRALETRQEILALDRRIPDYGTMAQDAQDIALRRGYHALEVQTVGLAVAGGATVVVAAVLAGVGGRRMARAASRTTAFLPAPGGLVFHARF